MFAVPPAFRLALLVAASYFMENLDGTVIATALPQMAVSFSMAAVDLNVGMTSYLLTLAVLIPVSGWIADRFGPRSVFTAAIGVFTAASILCSLANSLESFVAARIVQGFGGAMMVPVGRLLVLRTTEKSDLMRAIAYLTWPALVAPILGPPLGGWITQYLSWRWIFFLNIPMGIAGIIAAWRIVPAARLGDAGRFDAIGFVLMAAGCAGLLYGLDLAGIAATPWSLYGGIILGSIAAMALAFWHMSRIAEPLFDTSALRITTYAVSLFGGSLFRIAVNALPFLMPLLFQAGFGYDPLKSGLLVLAIFAGNLGMKPLTTWVLVQFGFKTVLLWNGVITAFLIAGCALLSPETPLLVAAALLFAGGLSRSMQYTALNTIGFADVPKAQLSRANSLWATLFQVNSGFGIAIGALVLRASASSAGRADVAVADFRVAFLALALIALLGAADCLRLDRDAGAAVSGHVPRPRAG